MNDGVLDNGDPRDRPEDHEPRQREIHIIVCGSAASGKSTVIGVIERALQQAQVSNIKVLDDDTPEARKRKEKQLRADPYHPLRTTLRVSIEARQVTPTALADARANGAIPT